MAKIKKYFTSEEEKKKAKEVCIAFIDYLQYWMEHDAKLKEVFNTYTNK